MRFDAEYLIRLKRRDPETCDSFVLGMTPVLDAALRCQFRDPCAVEDARNETFYRVFTLVDRERVQQPEHLGSFVRGVCNRVACEVRRKIHFTEPLPEDGYEPADRQPPTDMLLAGEETRARLRRELAQLHEADRRLLMEVHFEQRDRLEMARERGVTASGLNVRVCRALKRLRARMLDQSAA